MPATDFKTVPEELLQLAVDAQTFFEDEGYEVLVERKEIGFPFLPTLLIKRDHETIIVEVISALDDQRIDRWIRFCHSQSEDTRFGIVINEDTPKIARITAYAQSKRFGLFAHGDEGVTQLCAPMDLAVQVDLPEQKDLPANIRPLLAAPFAKIRRGDWRDGLNDTYLLIEDKGRDYLKSGIDSGRIVIANRRGQSLTSADVDGMTMGQLSNAFSRITRQNQKDSIIGTTLAMINPTRVLLTHRRRQPRAEEEIRRSVGKHVYTAIGCLEEIIT